MRQSSNPAVVALELEVAELKRKLYYLERKEEIEGSAFRFDRDGLDLGTIDIGSRKSSINIPLRAEIEAVQDWNEGRIRVTGRTRETYPNEGIGLQYFVTDREAYDVRDQAALLGHLHERFVRDLAEFIRK